ncbi:hypothetical protein [Oscillibacter sp.]|uniref:hypothetical protein n=1 Tax=Oscillibacter sp. TaxID=1945593 RepID=UPI003397424E
MDKALPRDLESPQAVSGGASDAIPGGYPHPPVPTDAESVDMVAAAEARIATSLASFLELFLQKVCMIRDPAEQAKVIKDVLCAYTCKEKAMAALFNALANKILADKGAVPGDVGDCGDCC